MNNDISRAVLAVLSDLGIEARSYSGRAMYGAECVGVDVGRGADPCQVVAQIVIGLMNESEEEAAEHFTTDGAVRTDSMGLGSIVYFPRLPWLETCDCGDIDCEKSACQDDDDGCDDPDAVARMASFERSPQT